MFFRPLCALALIAGGGSAALAQSTASPSVSASAEAGTANPVQSAQTGQAPADAPAEAETFGPTPEELKLLATAAAMSQSVFAQDFYMTVGLGAGMVPSYEGSDQYVFFPAPVVQGSYKGYNFGARGPGLFVDLIKDPLLPSVEYIAGPVIRARIERNNRIRDAVVQRLGTRPVAVEAGASGGIKINRIFNRFDSLTFQADAVFDISGTHSGAILTPQVSYNRLLGTKGVVNLSLSGDFVDSDFADYYFSVDAAGSAASGLPRYRAGGGLKSIGTSALVAFDLSGNALDGGWGVFVLGSYSRLQGDIADSPIVSLRGDADQFFGGAGLTYTF
ncbi:MAG: MipA/OmpV family protein [Blastomonas sp.]